MNLTTIGTAEEASRAKYEIELFLLKSEEWVLCGEGGREITRSVATELEASVNFGKLILAWWNSECSESVRVIGWRQETDGLVMRVTRGLGGESAMLVLRRGTAAAIGTDEPRPMPPEERRRWYASLLAEALRDFEPGCVVRRMTTGPYRQHGLAGGCARLEVSHRGERMLVIGVGDDESAATIDGVVATGLVWLGRWNHERPRSRRAQTLRICLPPGRSLTVLERVALLDIRHLDARIECAEFDQATRRLTLVRPFTRTELITAHPRELVWPLSPSELARRGGDWLRRIVALAPEVIEAVHRPARDEIGYAIHGIEFARQSLRDEDRLIRFGVAGSGGSTILDELRFPELRRLVSELLSRRHAGAGDRRHPWFRQRTEGWLESLLRRDIRALDPSLDPRFVYSQIPAWRADERSVIDLLCLSRQRDGEARLVVIEIKAAEDPQLPLQGLDYWLRVEQARARDEFTQRGFFPGVSISARPPLLYLVAPRLRFHRSFDAIARCLHPQIEAWRFGINSDWRSGVRVHSVDTLGALGNATPPAKP